VGSAAGWDGTEVVAAGDLLFAWGADRNGLVYRAATPGVTLATMSPPPTVSPGAPLISATCRPQLAAVRPRLDATHCP
jgi:hypothetical protein